PPRAGRRRPAGTQRRGDGRVPALSRGSRRGIAFRSMAVAEDFDNVPSAGGQLTGTPTIQDTINPRCRVLGTRTVPWISGSIGVGKFTLTVAPNPSPGTARSGAVEFIGEAGGSARLTVTQR